jgi:hypothetical protein
LLSKNGYRPVNGIAKFADWASIVLLAGYHSSAYGLNIRGISFYEHSLVEQSQ